MAKTAALSVRIPGEIKVALDRAAADDHRTVASFVEKAVADALRARGYLPPLLEPHPVDLGAAKPKPVSTDIRQRSRRRGSTRDV